MIFSVVLVSYSEIGVVKAEGTIYIRSDGSVEGTDKIHREGNVYTFISNIDGSIVVEKDNIVIDGANFTLQGSGYEDEKGIYLKVRNNVTIYNLEVTGYRDCIFLENTTNSNITQNKLSTYFWENGIHLVNSTNNIISENNITSYAELPNSQPVEIFLQHSTNNNISKNYVSGGWISIWLSVGANNNTVYANNITLGQVGLEIVGDGNQVYENNIFGTVKAMSSEVQANNGEGIRLTGSVNPENNIIFKNNFTKNGIAIFVKTASNNSFYHNNFYDNSLQVDIHEYLPNPNNTWDNGLEGNYWDNYVGSDNDGDGIGDTPYVIDQNNQDNYPLMEPVIIPEFPSWTLLLVLLIAGLTVILVRKKMVSERYE